MARGTGKKVPKQVAVADAWHDISNHLSSQTLLINEDNATSVNLDLRKTNLGGVLDILIFGPTAANDLADVTIGMRPLYEDANGDLQDTGETDIAILTNVNMSAGAYIKQRSITMLYIDGGSPENFMHGAGILISGLGIAGDIGNVTLYIGSRS